MKLKYVAMSLVAGASAAHADLFTAELTGLCDAELSGGRQVTGATYTITFVGDTDDRQNIGSGVYDIMGSGASFTVDGLGSGDFVVGTRIFVNQGGGSAGFSTAAGPDLLDLRSPQFATWDMLTSIGPIFDPNPFAVSQFSNIETSIGLLTLTAIDVTFTVEVSRGCYADCDTNGTLDIFDFLCFQDAFVQGDPYAECDGNMVFDIFDFLCFQDAFVTGCP